MARVKGVLRRRTVAGQLIETVQADSDHSDCAGSSGDDPIDPNTTSLRRWAADPKNLGPGESRNVRDFIEQRVRVFADFLVPGKRGSAWRAKVRFSAAPKPARGMRVPSRSPLTLGHIQALHGTTSHRINHRRRPLPWSSLAQSRLSGGGRGRQSAVATVRASIHEMA